MPTVTKKLDSLEKKHGGARKGAGKKKGTVVGPSLMTQKKQLVHRLGLEYIRDRVSDAKHELINSQLTLARGLTHLYKIEKERIVGPKGGVSYRPKRPEMVTTQWEIELYLNGLVDKANGEIDDDGPGATYYYLTTTSPDNRAIDSLLDRTVGKAPDTVKHEGVVGIVQLVARLEHEDSSNS